MLRIFVSNRLDAGVDVATDIANLLRLHFGPGSVFTDIDSTLDGAASDMNAKNQVERCDVLLLLIGGKWQTFRNTFDLDDTFRQELVSAIIKHVPIIPIVVDDASMPAAANLPIGPKGLARKKAADLRTGPTFLADVKRLIDELEKIRCRDQLGGITIKVRREEVRSTTRPLDALTKVHPAEEHRYVEAHVESGAIEPPVDQVDCTVFAPPQAEPLANILVQVFLHTPQQRSEAQSQSEVIDDESQLRASKSLGLEIKRRATLGLELALSGLTIDDRFQEVTWKGETQAAQFGVTVPENQPLGNVIGTVTVIHASVPIGHLKFKLKIVPKSTARTNIESEPLGDEAKHYDVAFVSYSSKDREKVLARVQGILAAGIKCRQDILDLDPGDRWERKLYTYIDECDLFLLFWSREAKDSEWVLKEVRYALDRKHGDDLSPPEIRPVPLELPLVEPPDELKHLHFNDRLLYLMPSAARSDS